MTLYVEDQHGNNNPPTRAEFASWTIHARHVFIKRDLGSRRKVVPGTWCYLFYPEADMVLRFKLNRRKEIACHEVLTIEEGNRLCPQGVKAATAPYN